MSRQSKVIGALPIVLPKKQADATLNQANPVSNTEYTVLDTTRNVRISGLALQRNGGTVSDIRFIMTIDGQTIHHLQNAPADGTFYYAKKDSSTTELLQLMDTSDYCRYTDELYTGRHIKITARCTWTVQPTSLVARVKYSKW